MRPQLAQNASRSIGRWHCVAARPLSTLASRSSSPAFLSSQVQRVHPAHHQSRRFFFSPPGSKSGLISTQPTPDGKEEIPVVLVPDAKKIWDDFDTVVDVREANEVAEGMIPGAVHIPLGKILENPRINTLQDKKQILVYCRSGIRSANAVQALKRVGVNAVNLGGGYLAWQGDK